MRNAASKALLAFTLILSLTALVGSASFAAVTTGTIRGTVSAADGGPLSGVLVQLFSTGQTAAVDYTKTDKSGVFVFSGETPGNYTVKSTIVGYQVTEEAVTVTQEITSTVDFSLARQIGATGSTRIIVGAVKRGTTGTTYTVTQQQEQQREPNPTASYQYPGLVVGVPGVTFDPSGGYVHLRGSDENAVGFEVDGMSNTDAGDNQFTTNIVSVGLKDANVEIGGQDPSVGGSLGGAINEVTKDGRDLVTNGKDVGGMISNEDGPGRGWNYTGSEDEIGGVVGNKFDYYATTIVFRNRFPEAYNGEYNLPDSYDGLYKVNYYMDKNDKFTAYYGKGNEEYELQDNSDPNNPSPADPYQWQEGKNNVVFVKNNFRNHEMQSYKTGYFAYQHKINAKSFISLKIDNNPEHIDEYLDEYVGAPGIGEGVYINYDKTSNELSYDNQITPMYKLDAGYQYTPEHDSYNINEYLNGPTGAPYQTNGFLADEFGLAANGYYQIDHNISFDRNALYLNNELKPMGQKLTIDVGARDESLEYKTKLEGNFTKRSVNPRLGAVYSPTNDFLIRTSYSTTSQFADGERVEYLGPEEAGFGQTSTVSGIQDALIRSRYADSKPSPELSNNVDFGIEKAFAVPHSKGPISDIFGGSYSIAATAFQRVEKDLLQYTRAKYDDPYGIGAIEGSGLRSYQSLGGGHSSGVELELSKRPKSQYDQNFNGFVTYTNETDRVSSSFFDTSYNSYFANAFLGEPGLTVSQFQAGQLKEYAPSWDQKHTFFTEISKRVGKIINFHLNLDSGSGYADQPGTGVLANNGFTVAGIDAQHAADPAGVFNGAPVYVTPGNLQPLNPTPGRTGWHYKFGLNTDFDLSKTTTLFVDTDNIFDKKTVLISAPRDAFGNEYYTAPSFGSPQGFVSYGPRTIVLPVYVSFGFRQKF